jgi:hypothetical protein
MGPPRAGPKYPLDPLLHLREAQADDAAKGLAEAVREREAAAVRREKAERDLANERQEQQRVRDAERAALDGGALTAADLARAGTWEVAARSAEESLAEATARRSAELAAALANEEAERANVARRQADAAVIDKDKGRFEERARKGALAKEEEAAEELWRRKG